MGLDIFFSIFTYHFYSFLGHEGLLSFILVSFADFSSFYQLRYERKIILRTIWEEISSFAIFFFIISPTYIFAFENEKMMIRNSLCLLFYYDYVTLRKCCIYADLFTFLNDLFFVCNLSLKEIKPRARP